MPTNRQVRFILKPVVFAACLAPLVFIGLRIAGIGPSLGPNPVEVLQDEFGEWALRMLLATLTITPLRLALGKPWPLRLRRMLGLFAFTYAALHFANYLVLDQEFDWPIIVEDILDRPFITVGFSPSSATCSSPTPPSCSPALGAGSRSLGRASCSSLATPCTCCRARAPRATCCSRTTPTAPLTTA